MWQHQRQPMWEDVELLPSQSVSIGDQYSKHKTERAVRTVPVVLIAPNCYLWPLTGLGATPDSSFGAVWGF